MCASNEATKATGGWISRAGERRCGGHLPDWSQPILSKVSHLFDARNSGADSRVFYFTICHLFDLSCRHIKSHLQKYRIQSERSNEQFIDFFEKHMRAEFHQFLTAYESSNDSVSELSKKKVEPLDSHQAPLLVVATEPVLISSASTQPGFDNGGDATRSDSTGSVTGAPPTDLEKLKAEFDSAYKESLDIKNSLTEFTGVL